MTQRITQRQILPTAVKSKGLGDIISVSDTQSFSATLNNGDDAIFTIIATNDKKVDMIGEVEFSLWKTSISDANLILGGTSITPSNYQIMGPWNEWSQTDLTGGVVSSAMPNYAIVSKIYIRNISAGASTVIVGRGRIRYITSLDVVTIS